MGVGALLGDDRPPGEAETLRTVRRFVAGSLPRGWSVQAQSEGRQRGDRPDLVLVVEAPDGVRTELIVEVKRAHPRDLPRAVERARRYGGQVLIAAPFLSARAQDVLRELGVSFADTTGNLRLVADRPGLFVERQGARKDPWPADGVLQSLRGPGAGRAVRALVDFRPPYGVRELAIRASVPLGSLARVLELFDREGLVDREPRGPVRNVDWEGAIRRWSADYAFARSNRVSSWLEPRGLSTLTGRLSQAGWRYAATGAFAAQAFDPIAPARQAKIYTDDPELAADNLALRRADSGANVLLAEPYHPVVFERTLARDGLRLVSPSQLAVDLLTGSGREPSEADQLLSWMRKNQDEWRT